MAENRFEAEGALALHEQIAKHEESLNFMHTRLTKAERRADAAESALANARTAFIEMSNRLAQTERDIKVLSAMKANKRDVPRSSNSQRPEPEPDPGFKCHINCPDRFHDDEATALEHKKAFTEEAAAARKARIAAAQAAKEAEANA